MLDAWFYALEEDALAADRLTGRRAGRRRGGRRAAGAAAGRRSAGTTPAFAAALRGYRAALVRRRRRHRRRAARLAGRPAARRRRRQPRRRRHGATSTTSARWASCRACSTVLRDCGHPGLLLVLDEVETLQRVRGDVRDKAPQRAAAAHRRGRRRPVPRPVPADHRHAGLLRRAAGRPAAAAAGPAAGHRLRHRRPLRQPARRPDPAARLRPSTRCSSSARRCATCTPTAAPQPDRIRAVVDDAYVADLAGAVAGAARRARSASRPRLFLKKLVADVLDRVDQFADFDPRQHYALTVDASRADRGRAQRAPRADDRRRLDSTL